MILLYITLAVILGMGVRRCLYECKDKKVLAITISSCFVYLTIPISIYHTVEHLKFFMKPKLQSQIVRIVWLVPIYALESMFSIMFYDHSFYFQALRELYEAYAIYCFMRYLLHYLGDSKNLILRLSLKSPIMGVHKSPFCYLPPWQMGSEFLNRCKAGVFQYVIIRFLLTVISIILHMFMCYEEGNYSIDSAYLYMTIINCSSQWWALYSLLLFYQSSEIELSSIRPVAKLFCIKFCIFFSWWQGN
jgi:hypothetical protein